MPRDLISEILAAKSDIKRAGLQVTLSRNKKRFDLKSIEQAACFYIKKHNLNINVSSIIDDVTRKAVQDNLTSASLNALPKQPIKKGLNRISLSKSDDPFIDNLTFNAAYYNAEIYPVIYLFENSVRKFIVTTMKRNFGDNWWTEKVENVNTTIKRNVEIRRLAEKEAPWHSKRGADPIFYTDIKDLQKIISTYSQEFRKTLKSKYEHVLVWIDEIEKTRNILAHNNPVTKEDKQRLMVFAHDWNEYAKSIYQAFK